LDAQGGILGAFADTLGLLPDAISEGVETVLDALQEKVVAPIDAVIDAAQEQAEEVITKLGGLLTVVLEAISTQISGALEPLKDLASDLGSTITGALTDFLPNLFDFLAPGLLDHVLGIVNAFEETPDLPDDIKALTAPGSPQILGAAALLVPLMALSALHATATAVMSPWLQNTVANINRLARPIRLTAGDSIRAKRRDFWKLERLQDELAQAGYSDERQDVLRQLDTEQLALQETLALWLRGEIDSDELTIRLEKLGFVTPDIESIKLLAFPIPGVQDLIQMAVREVFTPEIAEQFGQFDEIPPAYLEWTKKQGLTDFWSRNIWAAHWVLPSIQMGFEMLHRGELKEEQLADLFVAQDIMPFWRDKLAAISFKLITRVDIRRMHAARVMDDQEVFDSYKELGYNDEKATKLTDLVLAITAAKRAPKVDRERDLTRADIIGLFGERLIEKDEALESLGEIGFDPNESGLLIAREEIKMIVSERKAKKELIFDRFRVGSASFDRAQDDLVLLNLTKVELTQAQTDLLIIRERKTSMPSKADFDRFFRRNLITEDEYDEGLRLLGFAEHWIVLYRGLLDGAVEPTQDEEES